jgi:hypothetical protein
LAVTIENDEYIASGSAGRTRFRPMGFRQYEMINEFQDGSGKAALDTCREGLAYMFGNTDALIIRGSIPSENMAARQMATAFGATTRSEDGGIIEKRITIARWRQFNGL